MNEAYKYLYEKDYTMNRDWYFLNRQIIEKSETLIEVINEL